MRQLDAHAQSLFKGPYLGCAGARWSFLLSHAEVVRSGKCLFDFCRPVAAEDAVFARIACPYPFVELGGGPRQGAGCRLEPGMACRAVAGPLGPAGRADSIV